MIIQKAYKFRLYLTAQQEQQINIEFGNARFVWNHALNLRQTVYAVLNENMNYVPMNKHITQLKKTENYGWLANSTACVLTQKLIDLDKAYNNFFKGRAKFPKFKKKSHGQSIRYQLDQRQIDRTYAAGELLKLPKLGEINVRWSQIPAGTPKMATLSKTPSGKYFVSFACEVEVTAKPKTGKSVGIDVGIKDVIVTSDGFHSGAPKYTYYYQRRLKKAQRVLSRKIKGSNSWKKQRILVARIHEKIANSRKDFLHKLTTRIVNEYDHISLEDLNLSGMMKNRHLSKAIADVGIFELNRQLNYKAGWYGKQVSVISRWFPSSKTCSGCGQIHPMKLSDRIMNCDCGLSLCRDWNAAINIKAAGNAVSSGAIHPLDKAA
jgi:putative transposase